MKKINGDVTILISESGACIEVRDKGASMIIVDIKMAPRDFMAALGRLGHCPAELQVTEFPERIGTTMTVDTMEFPLPARAENLYGESCEKIAIKEGEKFCAQHHPGWVPDSYYKSQGSYFKDKGGKKWARTTIRKWE